jgi:prepilin-type N-terminal cleavage/methylation domain-containing protein
MRRQNRGFTLVELIIVIVVIAVLATITTLGLTRYQSNARNAERESDIVTITEALEKYYDVNGEYPSCNTLSGTPVTAANALKIDQSALKAPRSKTDNSFICTNLNAANDTDQFAYIGDTSATCQSGGSCLGWTIQYRDDETGTIKTVTSRRTATLATSGKVNLKATPASNTQINLSWTAVPNAASYRVEQSRNADMSSATTSTTTNTASSSTGLLVGTRYYYRVTPVFNAQDGAADTANAVTNISIPTGTLTASASLISSGAVARGTAGGVSCPAGTTIQYALGYADRSSNITPSINFSGWSTSTVQDVSARQGFNYTFQSKARCVGTNATSSEIVGTTSSVTRPILSPPAPTFNGDTSMLAGYRYLQTYSTYCPSGTRLNGTVNIWNTGYSGVYRNPSSGYFTDPNTEWWFLGWNDNQVWEDLYYYAIYQCASDFATSPDSTVSTTYMTVECEPGRRSFSAYPRCDTYGQPSSSLPWGP